ncbi:MAG: hypothetical protein PHV49_00425, partial [Alistipes sp.]|nr:hypothetical protein [Alistipes sp.]
MFRLTRSVLLLVVCCGITACQPSLDSKLRQCTQWMEEGQFSQTDSLLAQIERDAPSHQRTVDSLREIMRRWRLEFRYNETEMLEQLRHRISDTVSLAQMAQWEEQGALEMRRFEGQKYYFKNALNNLIRLEPALQPLRSDTLYRPYYQAALIQAILSRSDSCGKCVLPVTTTLHYQITVPANAVPEGDTLRC